MLSSYHDNISIAGVNMYLKNLDVKRKDEDKLIIRLPKKTKYNFKMYCLKKNKSMNSVVSESIESMVKEKIVESKEPKNFFEFMQNSPWADVELSIERDKSTDYRDINL